FVAFYRGQAKVFETQPRSVTNAMSNRLKTMPLRFDLTLDQLSPGAYNCQVTVLDPTGQKAAFWQAPIVVVE
ncbi:MAG: VWA domain-containing protein, partial [Bryobacteraceae bacterium]